MDPLLITKYFSGRCSDEELRQVLSWFQTQKGQVFLRKQIRNDCQRLIENKNAFRCRAIDTQKVFERIIKSIGGDGQSVRKNNTAMLNNRLSFEKEPLWKVSRRLESIYEINIEFQSEQLKGLNLTADFKQKNAEITLQTIANLLDIQCKKTNNSNFVWQKPTGASCNFQ